MQLMVLVISFAMKNIPMKAYNIIKPQNWKVAKMNTTEIYYFVACTGLFI